MENISRSNFYTLDCREAHNYYQLTPIGLWSILCLHCPSAIEAWNAPIRHCGPPSSFLSLPLFRNVNKTIVEPTFVSWLYLPS